MQQVWFATEANKVRARQGVEVVDRGRHGVRHRELHGVVARFLGIQLGRIARQPFHPEIVGVSREKCLHGFRAVRRQVIPHDEERPAQARAEMPQGHDHVRAVNRAPKMAGVEPRALPVERRGHGDETRDLAPLGDTPEDGRVAAGRPRGDDVGPKRETCFVQEGNDPPASTSPFLIRGQSRRNHAAMRASLRSAACVAGRCGVHPCARRMRPQERQWWRTPHVRCATALIRRSVHRSVSNPAATAPRRNTRSSWRQIRRSTCGGRPVCGRRPNAARPPRRTICCHRLTLWRLTPTRRATAAGESVVRSRSRKASNRRASSCAGVSRAGRHTGSGRCFCISTINYNSRPHITQIP
jgi:hypothetical protein